MDLDAALQSGRLADIATALDSQELQVRVWWEGEGGRGRETRHDPPPSDPTPLGPRGSCSPAPRGLCALHAGTWRCACSSVGGGVALFNSPHSTPSPQSDGPDDPLLPPWPAPAHMLAHMLNGNL